MKQEEKIQIFIEQFNKDFGTDLKLEEKSFLINLYQNYIKIYKSEEMNKRMLKGILDIADKISRNFKQEWQQQEFKEWNRLNDEVNANWELQAFVYGYLTCKQLENETLRNTIEEKICPKCGKEIIGYPALSRKDNKTKICSNCGIKEALEIVATSQENKGK